MNPEVDKDSKSVANADRTSPGLLIINRIVKHSRLSTYPLLHARVDSVADSICCHFERHYAFLVPLGLETKRHPSRRTHGHEPSAVLEELQEVHASFAGQFFRPIFLQGEG